MRPALARLLLALAAACAGCPGSTATHRPRSTHTDSEARPNPLADPLAASPPQDPDPPRETKSMTSTPDPVARLLRLPDAEFFSLTDDRRIELQAALSEIVQGPEGEPADPRALPPRLALGAPQRVEWKAGGKIPVLLGSFQTGQRAWEVGFHGNLLLLVKSHASGELAFATPLVNMRRGARPEPSRAGAPPNELNATSTRSGVTPIDLREWLGERLRPGRISVTAVAYDIRSNTVELELHTDAPVEPPPVKVSAFVRSTLDARPILDHELHVPRSGSARDGIEIRVAVQTTSDASIVRSEFNQPVLSSHLVLVRIDESPVIVPTFVPVQPVVNGEGKPAHNALFIAELGAQGHAIEAGEYQVYLEVDAGLRGPHALTVTD
jgi:hypothetical protein